MQRRAQEQRLRARPGMPRVGAPAESTVLATIRQLSRVRVNDLCFVLLRLERNWPALAAAVLARLDQFPRSHYLAALNWALSKHCEPGGPRWSRSDRSCDV